MQVSTDFYVVALGSSAGGLDVLREFFNNLNSEAPAAFVVVSHLPANEATMLHYILGPCTDMPVVLLSEDITLQPYVVYIVPGNLRVKYSSGQLVLRRRLSVEKVNYAIDEFLLSLAEGIPERTVAIILSGMGKDGTVGSKTIHEKGGVVLVQAPSTTQYASMPMSVITADHPMAILKPSELAKVLNEVIKLGDINQDR